MNPSHIRVIEIDKINTEEDLDKQALVIENFFQTLCGITKRLKKPYKKNQKVDRNNRHEIRGLYEHQMHRAVQEILFGPTYYCTIDKNIVEDYYIKLLGIKSSESLDFQIFTFKNDTINDQDNTILVQPFKPKAVRQKLLAKIANKLCNSKSVGLDELKYYQLLKCDPDCFILTAYFNACLKLQMVPKHWGLMYSVLIKKRKDLDDEDIKNWRAVTLQNTTPKLFQALIAARLIVWAKNTNRLSATQKGYLLNDASCEISFILQECKKYAQNEGKELAVAWLDFSSASDSIPQKTVLQALQSHSVPESIVNIVRTFLINAKTKIRVKEQPGYTNYIDIVKGLPQGSPLNPILIDLAIEPVLRQLSLDDNNVFNIFEKKINHFVIPNELTLIAESSTKLQNLLNLVQKTAKSIGLHFNHKKCSTYHYDGNNNEIKESKFLFFEQKLQVLTEDKINENFGVKQGLCIGQDGVPTINEMITSIEEICNSKLDEFQKLESIQLFIIPRLENCLRGLYNVSETSIKEADQVLEDKIKLLLYLPENATSESIVYHLDSQKLNEQANLLPLLDLMYIMKIIQGYEMLNSSDEVVKFIAYNSLKADIAKLKQKTRNNIKKQELSEYLNGKYSKHKESNKFWQKVQEATIYLKEKIPLVWQSTDGQLKPKLIQTTKKKNKIDFKNSYNIEKNLKKALVKYYVNYIKAKIPEQ